MEATNVSPKARRRSQLRRLSFWTLSWVLSEALVIYGHRELWAGIAWVTALAFVLNLFFGLGMVWAYRNLTNLLDELQRKIQLESMGLTLGLTLVAGVGFSVLDITDLIPWEAKVGYLILFMGICYIASIWINTKRYC